MFLGEREILGYLQTELEYMLRLVQAEMEPPALEERNTLLVAVLTAVMAAEAVALFW